MRNNLRKPKLYEKINLFFFRYATFLVRYPSAILCLVVLVVILAAVLGIVDSAGAKDLPDFSKPAKVRTS